MLTLRAEKRNIFGKQLKPARSAGKLPVVVYGRKTKSSPWFVQVQEFKKVFEQAGESAIISLATATGNENVLIHDVFWHPVTNEPIHADFYMVEKDVALKVKVPLEFTGVAPAIKELGGTLVKVSHELEIEALPQDLPPVITVDISSLATLTSQILIRDLTLPKAVKIVNRPDEVVASITLAEEEPVEPVAPVDLSAIEVEKRGKEETAAADETPAPPPL